MLVTNSITSISSTKLPSLLYNFFVLNCYCFASYGYNHPFLLYIIQFHCMNNVNQLKIKLRWAINSSECITLSKNRILFINQSRHKTSSPIYLLQGHLRDRESGPPPPPPLLILVLRRKSKKNQERLFFSRGNSLCRVVVPSPKIASNLPRIYEKLQCNGEPYRYRQTQILLYSHIRIVSFRDYETIVRYNNMWKSSHTIKLHVLT